MSIRSPPTVISLLSSPSPPYGRPSDAEPSANASATTSSSTTNTAPRRPVNFLAAPPQPPPPRSALKRPRSPTIPTSAPSKLQKSKDDSAAPRFQPRLSTNSWQRSRSHQVVGLSDDPPQRRTILGLFPRELVFVILAHLSFGDIRSLLKADRRLRPFVHLRSFAVFRKQLAHFQYHERRFNELVKRKGDAVYQSQSQADSGADPFGEPMPSIEGASIAGSSSGSSGGPEQAGKEVESAFLEAYIEALQALGKERPPWSPSELVAIVGRSFPGPRLGARLQQFVTDLLLGEVQASQAFEVVDGPTAVELLCLIRLFCGLLRISRGFAKEGTTQSEASQTAHYIDADCRDAVRGFFQPRHRRLSGGGAFQLTDEQSRFVNRDVRVGDLIKVQAFAGTGKTRSLVAYATARPHQRFLYIAFNTHAAADARYRFPSNVDCRTMHSVCLAQFQPAQNQKLASIKPKDVVSLFEQELPRGQKTVRPSSMLDSSTQQQDPKLTDTAVASYVLRTLNQFMYSDDRTFDVAKHVPKQMQRETDLPPGRVLRLAERLWEAVRKGKTEQGRPVHCPHDAYVKMLQLTPPSPPSAFFAKYDVLLLDEAQDLSAAQVSILLRARRTCGILVVGDAHQKIYGFRGGTARAFNDQLYAPTATFQLTQSFRFGDSVAKVASKILGLKAPAPWQARPDRPWLSGVKGDGDRVYVLRAAHSPDAGSAAAAAAAAAGMSGQAQATRAPQQVLRHTKIFRSNKCLVETALVYGVLLEEPHRIYLKTSQKLSQSSVVALLRDGYILYNGRGGPMSSGSILREFSGWKELVQRVEAEDQGGDGMLALVASLEDLFRCDDFLDRLDSLKSRFSATEKDASIVLTTCHQSKGLEWDRVVVADDFRPSYLAGKGRLQVDSLWLQDEVNLMYVAITRAKRELIVSGAIREWLAAIDGLCMLKAERMDGLTCLACGKEGQMGVVRVFRLGEHDFVLRPSGGGGGRDADGEIGPNAAPRRPDGMVAADDGDDDSDSDDRGPAPPYKKAVGCFACLDAHRMELDEDVVQFLDLYRQTQHKAATAAAAAERASSSRAGEQTTSRTASTSSSNGGGGTTGATTRAITAIPPPAAPAQATTIVDRTKVPLLVHPQRQANWDRIQVETVNTVLRWCCLERYPGLLPDPYRLDDPRADRGGRE
ncbi:uncharacterized protein PFL1_01180 [Pseudozyma flocculosa PF-1]|uniref:uncharacterized protein n=1 Tax=Pseudozyma flocculosa PF-1 TaxID=1277687 RepID=UPI000456053E|nr:uncharacterized protein PFL1_01180 [Pseudozyma flocculosa PF-1]EPQ30991.1 hypothetical protein PFL1_01180 [Pseudozyma flocculosa PF-1]